MVLLKGRHQLSSLAVGENTYQFLMIEINDGWFIGVVPKEVAKKCMAISEADYRLSNVEELSEEEIAKCEVAFRENTVHGGKEEIFREEVTEAPSALPDVFVEQPDGVIFQEITTEDVVTEVSQEVTEQPVVEEQQQEEESSGEQEQSDEQEPSGKKGGKKKAK